jgi:flavin-binding protein dodecin
MAESVYKIIEVVGTSPESWEKAATAAVNRAAKTLRDLRVAEIVQLDMQISAGKVEAYSREGEALLQVRRLGRRRLGVWIRTKRAVRRGCGFGRSRPRHRGERLRNERPEFGRFRPIDDKAVQEASQ